MTEHSKPDASSESASAPDELIKDLDVKISPADANQVRGGNKAKTADKAYTQMDGYIKQ